jgi:hypothetical protein
MNKNHTNTVSNASTFIFLLFPCIDVKNEKNKGLAIEHHCQGERTSKSIIQFINNYPCYK